MNLFFNAMNTTQTKHSPAPWHMETPEDHEMGDFVAIFDANDYEVSNQHGPLTKADAKLMVAAPKLLDALKDCLTICLSRGEKLGLDDKGTVLDKARETINSALLVPIYDT